MSTDEDRADAPVTLPLINLTRPRQVVTHAILLRGGQYVWDGMVTLDIGAAVRSVPTVSGRVYAVPQLQTITVRCSGLEGRFLADRNLWLQLPDGTRHAVQPLDEDTFVVVQRATS